MSVAAIGSLVLAGAATYSAVSASDNAAANRKNLDLNSAAGRKTAEQLAAIQHDDTLRQLNEQVNEFKARALLAAKSETNKEQLNRNVLILGAGLGAVWLLKKKR